MTEKKYPVVLRMAGLFPADLSGFECHRTRKGGDLGHVDAKRSHLNRRLIGSEDWSREVREEIQEMAQENFANELDRLKARRRKAELHKRITEGPRDPWRATGHGPLREVILTANRNWFDTVGSTLIDDVIGDSREDRFQAHAISWLQEHFGEDIVHARADLDEEAYHIHAVILPRALTKDGRHMLQPSKHPMIHDYEVAQDSVGEWFSDLGLVRGEKRAQAIRDALEHNAEVRGEVGAEPVPVPAKRQHVSPKEWRQQQELHLAARNAETTARETEIDKRETTVSDVIKIVKEVAKSGTLAVAPADAGDNRRSAAARTLFGKALARLRGDAQLEAQTNVARELEEIKAADDAIVAAARLLPDRTRRAIIDVRTSLIKRIISLSQSVSKWARARDEGPQNHE
jgi:hypothetical protein